MAQITVDDIRNNGGTCEVVAADFWECTDKDGKVWWCSNQGKDCMPKPRTLGTAEHLAITLDLVFVRDTETGGIVVAAPLVTESKTLDKNLVARRLAPSSPRGSNRGERRSHRSRDCHSALWPKSTGGGQRRRACLPGDRRHFNTHRPARRQLALLLRQAPARAGIFGPVQRQEQASFSKGSQPRPCAAAQLRRTRQCPAQVLAHLAQAPLLSLARRAARQNDPRPSNPRDRGIKGSIYSGACEENACTNGRLSTTLRSTQVIASLVIPSLASILSSHSEPSPGGT